MFIVLAILITAAALLAVAYPILSKGSAAKPATTAQESLDELLGQRDAAMQALRELNFDHRMGKISDEDFAVFELSLKQHAAETLRALDEWEAQTEDDLDQSLEREVAARRSQLIAGGRACPACGRQAADDDKFCAVCGAALAQTPAPDVLPPEGIVCAKCGRSADPDDRFCAGCGQAL
jgi:RNA polymerase subunit RPABC4/transcription elongation factor Spt4